MADMAAKGLVMSTENITRWNTINLDSSNASTAMRQNVGARGTEMGTAFGNTLSGMSSSAATQFLNMRASAESNTLSAALLVGANTGSMADYGISAMNRMGTGMGASLAGISREPCWPCAQLGGHSLPQGATMYNSGYSIGSRLSNGVADGMLSALGRITASAQLIIATARMAAAAAAMIHSPSRLFYDTIGIPVGLGAAGGISSPESMRAISASSRKLVECAAAQSYVPSDRIGSIGSASSGGGTTIFHIDQSDNSINTTGSPEELVQIKSRLLTPETASRTVAEHGNTRGRSGEWNCCISGANPESYKGRHARCRCRHAAYVGGTGRVGIRTISSSMPFAPVRGRWTSTNAIFRLGVMSTNASGHPDRVLAHTVEATTSVPFTGSNEGETRTFQLETPDRGQLRALLAFAATARSGILAVGMEVVSSPAIYQRDIAAGSTVPLNSYTSVPASGRMAIQAIGELNVAPTAPSNLAPTGGTNVTGINPVSLLPSMTPITSSMVAKTGTTRPRQLPDSLRWRGDCPRTSPTTRSRGSRAVGDHHHRLEPPGIQPELRMAARPEDRGGVWGAWSGVKFTTRMSTVRRTSRA